MLRRFVKISIMVQEINYNRNLYGNPTLEKVWIIIFSFTIKSISNNAEITINPSKMNFRVNFKNESTRRVIILRSSEYAIKHF